MENVVSKIKVKKDKIVLELRNYSGLDLSDIQSYLDYLQTKFILSKSKATESDIGKISNEINATWSDLYSK